MKTHTQYLMEVVEYFEKNPPGFDNGQPQYIVRSEETGKARYCAIGLIMVEPELFHHNANVFNISREYPSLSFLKPEYRNLDVDFLLNVQRWHDEYYSWEDADSKKPSPLNNRGKKALRQLIAEAQMYDKNNNLSPEKSYR